MCSACCVGIEADRLILYRYKTRSRARISRGEQLDLVLQFDQRTAQIYDHRVRATVQLRWRCFIGNLRNVHGTPYRGLHESEASLDMKGARQSGRYRT